MRISVRSAERSFSIKIPTALLCNAVTARILCSRAGHAPADMEASAPLSYSQARQLMRCLKKCSHAMKDFPLIEIEEKSGKYIQITL